MSARKNRKITTLRAGTLLAATYPAERRANLFSVAQDHERNHLMLAAKTTFTRWGLTVWGFGAQIASKTRLVITGVSAFSPLSRIAPTDLMSKWTWQAKTNSKVIKASNCVSLRLITRRSTAACVFTVSLSASCVIQTQLFCLQMPWRAKRRALCLILVLQWKKKFSTVRLLQKKGEDFITRSSRF